MSRQTGGSPAYQSTGTTYTLLNKPSVVTDPLGHQTQYGYDSYGRRTATLDAMNQLRQYVLDTNGRLQQIIDANGAFEETRGLYPGGPVHTITDANGNTSTFTRDSIARLTQITYPDNTTEQWTLDNNGNVTQFTTRDGKTIGQVFDPTNRATSRSPQGQPTVTMSYDLAGRLLYASTPVVAGDPSSGKFSRGYDAAGRLTSELSPNQTTPSPAYDTISYQLDPNGNVTKITYPSGYYVTRAYDQLDRVTSITLNGAAKPAATFTYDGLDRRVYLNFNNGAETAYSYDIGNNRQTTDIVSGSTSLNFSYQYNKVNQMIDKKTSDATYEWLLSTAASITYGTASNLNAYPTVGGVTQTYDTAGRLTNDGTFTYVYNTEGMLTQVKNAAGTAVVASYAYDPFKRLVLKTVTTPSSVTRYVYSGTQLMEEYNCSGGLPGTLIRRYVYASPGEAIFQIDASGNVTYLLNDHQGSLIAQANGSGTVLNKYTYSPFGENTGLPGSVIGYTGQRYDSETGLYYYKARFYKPSIGRFLQPDPIGYAAGMNLYGYVHNDPVNKTDPTGTEDQGSNADLFGHTNFGREKIPRGREIVTSADTNPLFNPISGSQQIKQEWDREGIRTIAAGVNALMNLVNSGSTHGNDRDYEGVNKVYAVIETATDAIMKVGQTIQDLEARKSQNVRTSFKRGDQGASGNADDYHVIEVSSHSTTGAATNRQTGILKDLNEVGNRPPWNKNTR